MSIKASASVDLAPKGNQIAIVVSFVISAVFLMAAVWLEIDNRSFLLPLLIGLLFLAVGAAFWWKSHRNESLNAAHPFTVKVGEGAGSLSVSSDARSLPALDYLKAFLGHHAVIFHREPLPEPSGMVDSSGAPTTGTFTDAKAIVDSANAEALKQAARALKELHANMEVMSVESPVVESLVSEETGAKEQSA